MRRTFWGVLGWCKGFIAGITAFLVFIFGVIVIVPEFKIKYKSSKGKSVTLE